MPDWSAIFDELRGIRTRLDQIAALATSEQTREELMPIWSCGHRHPTRGEAIRCKRKSADEPLTAAQQAALNDYHSAKTHAEERAAYMQMMALGMPDSYGGEGKCDCQGEAA